jgi:hypothetical protein
VISERVDHEGQLVKKCVSSVYDLMDDAMANAVWLDCPDSTLFDYALSVQ